MGSVDLSKYPAEILSSGLDGGRPGKAAPLRVLECEGISGMRVELWGPSAAGSHATSGCDVDALRFHLEDCPSLDAWTNGAPEILPACPAHSCSMLNYWPSRYWEGRGARMIVFRMPHDALASWARANGHEHFNSLRFRPGLAFFDPVLANFALALERSLSDSRLATPAFTSVIFEALLAYVVDKFGESTVSKHRGGLAGWQIRAVKRLVATRLQSQVQLGELAELCSLSTSHFVKAFRVSIGHTPHQWLIGRRIERARELLESPSLPLTEVAAQCGFSDQSHFTRTFTRAAGVSPGAWRKQTLASGRATGRTISLAAL